LIRRFNDEGFDALRQKTRSGRPPKLTEEEESIIAEIATAPPQAMGRPFNQWSLRKLRDFLVERKMIQPVGHNVIRRVLKNRKKKHSNTSNGGTRTLKTSGFSKHKTQYELCNRPLDIQLGLECVLLDKPAPRCHFIPHQHREQAFGLERIIVRNTEKHS
jgi:hypothetical protein